MERRWIGYNFITQEGNEIIKKAIAHYKARLENITKDKNVIELGGTFVGLFEQESQKTLETVNEIIDIVVSGDMNKIRGLEHQVPILEKALNCLKYDISKTEVPTKEKNSEGLEKQNILKDNLPDIEKALQKIKEYGKVQTH